MSSDELSRFMWLLPRKVYRKFASLVRLYTTPPFNDHVEVFLYFYTGLSFHNAAVKNLVMTVVFLLVLQLKKSFRWQLFPLYAAIGTSIFLGMENVVQWIGILMWLLSGALCLIFPAMPPIVLERRRNSIGVQDFCLKEPNTDFWVRFYYPCELRKSKSCQAYFSNFRSVDLVLIMIGLLVAGFPSLYFVLFVLVHLVVEGVELYSNMPKSDYMPNNNLSHKGLAYYMRMPSFVFSHMPLIQICCYEDAKPIDSQLKVAFVLHGLSGIRTTYSSICLQLAAEGYLVICPEFGDGSPGVTVLPDSVRFYRRMEKDADEHQWRHSQLQHRQHEINVIFEFLEILNAGVGTESKDKPPIQQVLRETRWKNSNFPCHGEFAATVAGKINMSGVVFVGHSFGGASALYAATSSDESAVRMRQHYPLKCLVLYDPWMFPLSNALRKKEKKEILCVPVLCMHAEYFQWAENLAFETAVISAAPIVIQLRLNDAGHMNFTEGCNIAPIVTWKLRSTGRQNPEDLLDKIGTLTTNFLKCIHTDKEADGPALQSLFSSLNCSHPFSLLMFKS